MFLRLKQTHKSALQHKLLGLAFTTLLSSTSYAHLPTYEGERIRNDNHFTKNGFAEPIRGECDINADGPTDENAGSVNIFLGGGNVPPNFFCSIIMQDDWSFDYPMDIIEETRVPLPDPTELGMEIEEGYIPCSPLDSNPYQCPRKLTNPLDGTTTSLPGQCVDTGQPHEPEETKGPDGSYHCGLLPGAPRPRTNNGMYSTLTGADDVDWAVYRYDPVFGEQPIVGTPQVPACRENLKSFITFAYAGPLDLVDAKTGEKLFKPITDAGLLPDEIVQNLPGNYGIRVKRPDRFNPSKKNPRAGYASGYGQNGWLLAPHSVYTCIDDYQQCLSGELAKHYTNNDIFFVDSSSPVDLYLMWWMEEDAEKSRSDSRHDRRLIDASMVTGVIDQFTFGDTADFFKTVPFVANGRYVHGKCTDPRKKGRAIIEIETN